MEHHQIVTQICVKRNVWRSSIGTITSSRKRRTSLDKRHSSRKTRLTSTKTLKMWRQMVKTVTNKMWRKKVTSLKVTTIPHNRETIKFGKFPTNLKLRRRSQKRRQLLRGWEKKDRKRVQFFKFVRKKVRKNGFSPCVYKMNYRNVSRISKINICQF